ncbi:MAG: ABC transporter permease, partial [Gammaproteobacteria bacterium]|nr:ABC transporter permease [Gammaproteobacteria bacterium]
MLNYILRRILYAFPILVGVNLITFFLFFVVNTPDDMARMQLGMKHVTPEAVENWKQERGYDRPLFWDDTASGVGVVSETLLFIESTKLFRFDFGVADDGRDIGKDIRERMGPSLA